MERAIGDWNIQDFRCLRRKETERVSDTPLSDNAPFRLWKIAHEDNYAFRAVFSDGTSELRRYGYVIWDMPPGAHSAQAIRKRLLIIRSQRRDQEYYVDQNLRTRTESSWSDRFTDVVKGRRGYRSNGNLGDEFWDGDIGEEADTEL